MELVSNFKRVLFKSCLAVLFCSILLWFSVFFYGLLYYSYIPAIAHFMPIYLRFDTACTQKEYCKFPSANITLVKQGHNELLTRGQAYAIEVALDMPESERNYNQGMFMVKIAMISRDGKILQSSLRPVLLHYRSPLLKVLYTFFYSPGLLAGTVEEKQHLVVSLFEQYEEAPFSPTYYVYIEIQAKYIEIYESKLRIHARFTGLRYFMYYWPITATIFFVGTNFFFFSVIFAFIWFRQIMNDLPFERTQTMSWREQQQLTQEIRKSVRKKQALSAIEPKSTEEDVNFQEIDSENYQRVEDLSSQRHLNPEIQETTFHDTLSEASQNEGLTASTRKRTFPYKYDPLDHPVLT